VKRLKEAGNQRKYLEIVKNISNKRHWNIIVSRVKMRIEKDWIELLDGINIEHTVCVKMLTRCTMGSYFEKENWSSPCANYHDFL